MNKTNKKFLYDKVLYKTFNVIDDDTGEIIAKDFIEIPKINKKIKGGFKMTYNEYDKVQEKVIKSQKDMCIFLALVKSFTYKNTEVKFDINKILNNCEVTKSKVYTMIRRLVENNMILRIYKGYYRLNPFIYIPYKSNGVELQQEWIELIKDR